MEFPVATLRKAAALGLAGIDVRAASGCSGLTRFDAAAIFEELAAACPSTAAYISIHNMVAWMIDSFGNDDQRARFLPRMLTMDDRKSTRLNSSHSCAHRMPYSA